MHTNPTDVQINVNYGLNPDGTVKDDDASRAWQEMVSDIRFRQALMLSIDAEEILDSVYKGFGIAGFDAAHLPLLVGVGVVALEIFPLVEERHGQLPFHMIVQVRVDADLS